MGKGRTKVVAERKRGSGEALFIFRWMVTCVQVKVGPVISGYMWYCLGNRPIDRAVAYVISQALVVPTLTLPSGFSWPSFSRDYGLLASP